MHKPVARILAYCQGQLAHRSTPTATLIFSMPFFVSKSWRRYGTMGIGGVLHTLNPRLSDKDLIYIANHAGDKVIMADITFVPLLQRILPHCPAVRAVVLLTDRCVARHCEGC